MMLSEVRVLRTNELVRCYDVTDVQDADGVQWAIDATLDRSAECVVRVERPEPLAEPVPTPAPLDHDPVMDGS